jgi:PAS domain S-box-containing protein
MTILQLAAFLNITGTLVAWLIALALIRSYPYPFFRVWTAAYGCGVLVACLEAAATLGWRPAWGIVLEIGLTMASASLLLRTSCLLAERPYARCWSPLLGLAGMALAAVMLGLGAGFDAIAVLPLLFLTFSFIRLGIALLGVGKRSGIRGAIWPAIPLIVHGALVWSPPLLIRVDALWVAYWLIGLVDTLVGVGMIVFMLEETAWQLRMRNSDLTGARDHLNRYRLLAERARDIILILDTEGRVIEANHAAIDAYGYTHEELLKKSLRELRAPETLADLGEHLAQAERDGLLLETQHITKDGARFPVEISARGMDLEGRRVLVSIIRDISERRRMEAMLREQNTRLLELDRLKGDFINAASHELRTPLTSIKGYAEFLEDEVGGAMTADQQAFVRQIQEGANRLQRIIDDMLDFARLEAGTFTLLLQEADLGAVVSAEVSSMAPQVSEARITLDLELPERPVRVRMDARRIGQVLLNLLSNAIKFTPVGGQIHVRLLPGPDHVRLEVRDTGIGIAPEHQSRLFEKFFQVDPSSTRQHGGAGLGLAISKALVDAHGGEMGLSSELGRGTTFWLELPVPAAQAFAPAEDRGLQAEWIGLD